MALKINQNLKKKKEKQQQKKKHYDKLPRKK